MSVKQQQPHVCKPVRYLPQVEVCPALKVPENAILNTSLAVYDTYVGIECLPGYYATNHTHPYAVHCMQGEQWSATLRPCNRKSYM